MKSYLLLVAVALFAINAAQAQVGIGNATPDTTSTLDLSNPDNRGLLLPSPSSSASMSSTTGMFYYFNSNLYYKRPDGYNALSPWKFKFNGNISNDVYYNLGGNIGIGNASLSASPEAPLQIVTQQPVDLVNNGTLIIGESLTPNMVVNATEIQTRDAASPAPLQINENGGDVTLGSANAVVDLKVTDKVKEYDQATGTYYDLVPTGTIVMWYGSTADVPVGWGICDGTTYLKKNGIDSITSPNLSGRFVVGSGSNGTTTYGSHDTGGADMVTLSTNQMPSHSHSCGSNGDHTHDVKQGGTTIKWGDDSGYSSDYIDAGGGKGGGSGNSLKTDTDGSHTHSIGSSGGSQAHENRPSFHALVYILKL